VDAKLEAM
jgi:hypothetical protein